MTKEDKQIIDRATKEEWRIGDRSRLKRLLEKNLKLYRENVELENELAEWKEEWQEHVQKATDEGRERTKLTGRVRELEQQIEKMKTELDNARESANRQEQWEIYSVLNDLYNDNFEITKGVSN